MNAALTILIDMVKQLPENERDLVRHALGQEPKQLEKNTPLSPMSDEERAIFKYDQELKKTFFKPR